ncbi:uncharacterized protein LOC106671986 [Cimex lectularius]|uniref:Uncharacterized protein n=1 Tax=Cimex lectularius TaxID=79782 RepID=A0A8I6TH01_CIMLE|nr:uncharacterized protein LOC106671986 [Cimex lectularius]
MSCQSIAFLLRRFSTQVLHKLIPMVMGVNWNQIQKILIRNRLSLQKKYIIQAAVCLYEDKKPTKADLEILSRKLIFFDVVNNLKLQWQCAKLNDQVSNFPNIYQLEKNIINAYKQEGRDAGVLVYEEQPLIFVKAYDKKYKHSLPLHFVIHTALPDEQYFFYSTNSAKNNSQIDHFCTALGYESYSSIPLSGKDVRNLFEIVKLSQEVTVSDIPDFDPVRVVERDGVVDFTLGEERCKYAEQIFHGLTNLNTFTIHADSKWKGNSDISNNENNRFLTTLTFTVKKRGHSVENIFKELIKAGAVKIPLPTFLANMTKVPKNNVSLSEDESDDSVMDKSY